LIRVPSRSAGDVAATAEDAREAATAAESRVRTEVREMVMRL
jgi:hypothetical protein